MRHTVASYTYLDVTVYKRFSTHKDLILRFTFAERAPLTETTFLNFIWVCTSDLNIQTRLVRALSTSRSTVEHNLPTELTRQNRTNTTNIVWFQPQPQLSFHKLWIHLIWLQISKMNVRKSEKNHQTKECEVRNDRRLFATEIEDPQKKPSTNCKTKNVTRDRASFQNNFMCYVGSGNPGNNGLTKLEFWLFIRSSWGEGMGIHGLISDYILLSSVSSPLEHYNGILNTGHYLL